MHEHRTQIHPLFPTIEQTRQQYDLLYSDHLPIFSTVRIDGNPNNDLKMLSYNVMGASAENNLTRTPEDDKKAIARYGRIAKGLRTSADRLNLDVIVLQEVSSDLMAQSLSDILGDEWEVLPDRKTIDEQAPQQLTCYRKARLALLKVKPWDVRKKTLASTFQCKVTNKIVHVHNVWTQYNAFPDGTEKYYRALLSAKQPEEISVVLGDTNSRVAPVDNEPRHLTTGVIPGVFNDKYDVGSDVQVSDHPDGVFCAPANSSQIYQLEFQTVDITTGMVSEDERRLGDITAHITNEKERAIWHTPRAILCLDHSYQETPVIQGKTIFEYENELKQNFGDNRILVRMTATLFNQKGIMVRFSLRSAVYQTLYQAIEDDESFTFDYVESDARNFPTVFVPHEKINIFAAAIRLICSDTDIDDIREQVNKLSGVQESINNISNEQLPQRAEAAIHKAFGNYLYRDNNMGYGRTRNVGETILAGIKIFGTFGSYCIDRRMKYDSRMNAAYASDQSPQQLLLNLLKNKDGGKGPESYKYYLASQFVEITASTPEEAEALVDCVRDGLEKKVRALSEDSQAIVSESDSESSYSRSY